MNLRLPPNISAAAFDKALAAFAGVVGKQWVLATDLDRETYRDIYQPANAFDHAPSAAVAPASVEEIQALLRLANEHKVPLWPISRGMNIRHGQCKPAPGGLRTILARWFPG